MDNVKRILCPVDFSNPNQEANKYASVLAAANEAAIVYLHLTEPEMPHSSVSQVNMDEEVQQLRLSLEKQFQPSIESVRSSYVVLPGKPAEGIAQYARENNVDLIVLGTHGRTGLGHALMGSVAEKVIRRATCPVLAIKANVRAAQSH